jgi:hypothetical protein
MTCCRLSTTENSVASQDHLYGVLVSGLMLEAKEYSFSIVTGVLSISLFVLW